MKPENIIHDLFLLMINLSQHSNCEKIKRSFGEAMENLIPGVTFTSSDNDAIESGEAIPIATMNRNLGWILVDPGDLDLSSQLQVLIRNAVRMLAIVLDNCQNRLEAEESLEHSARLYRNAFDNSPIGIVLVDAKGYIYSANDAFCQMIGYSEDELRQKRFNDITPSEFQQIGMDAFNSLISEKTSKIVIEKKYQHKDGRGIDCRIISTLLRDSVGAPLYFFSQIQDMTEQKLAEKKRQQLESQLRQAHKMEAVGTLAGGIAHDFNNILSIISGNIEMAIDTVEDDSELRLFLDEIKIAALRATEMVRQLLSFSHVTEPQRVPVSVYQIVTESLKLARAALPTSVEIKNQINPDVGVIKANATQIHEIVINLCTNAYHALDQGHGLLTVSASRYTHNDNNITPYANLLEGDYIELSISDNGCGIEQEMLERIYDPYFTTKPIGKGTGMGLAIVQSAVRSHNGAIRIDSEVGRGTTVIMLFPRSAKTVLIDEAKTREVPRGNERILLIDDEEMLVKMEIRILANLGYQVEAMTNPQEALDRFKAAPDAFDLVITDMTMPFMMGDRLAKELLNVRPDLPIILCTGYSEYIDKDKSEVIGIKKYIEKPVDIGEFARLVRQVINDATSEPID